MEKLEKEQETTLNRENKQKVLEGILEKKEKIWYIILIATVL